MSSSSGVATFGGLGSGRLGFRGRCSWVPGPGLQGARKGPKYFVGVDLRA